MSGPWKPKWRSSGRIVSDLPPPPSASDVDERPTTAACAERTRSVATTLEDENWRCGVCGLSDCSTDHLVAIVPGLYVGAIYHAKDRRALERAGVRTIVNCAAELRDLTSPSAAMARLSFDWHDLDDVVVDLDAAADAIHHALQLPTPDTMTPSSPNPKSVGDGERQADTDEHARGERAAGGESGVLVHCMMGRSRSATAAVAFLLKYRAETDDGVWGAPVMDRALARLRTARPYANPNPGFRLQLDAFARALQWRRLLSALCPPLAPLSPLIIALLDPLPIPLH